MTSEEVSVIKTISVVDIYGNKYEATYPKRAKGLVKKGRARFVDETTICLARPPYHTEDETMEENKSTITAPEDKAMHLDEAYSALRRQRQVNICEFKASLVYRVSSRTGSKTTSINPVLKNKTSKQTNPAFKRCHDNRSGN